MPALQKAKSAALRQDGLCYVSVTPPKQQRQTRIVKDRPADEIAAELLAWIEEQ
jgi:electron transfer flavoprotein beta subunit